MSLKQTWSLSVRGDAGGTVLATSEAKTGDAEENFSDTVAITGGTKQVFLNVDVSKIVSFYVYSDQDVTLETNAFGGSHAQTFDLLAKQPLWWKDDELASNPLTVDVTSLCFTNDGETLANIKGGFLLNAGS